jgi:CelD/BcsL family acetyltransferase involved in cellulose biosynthesis
VQVSPVPESQIDAMMPPWLDLAERSDAATPYNHPRWITTWWRQRRRLGLEWRCFAGRDRGRLLGVLPLVCYPDGVVRFAGHDMCDSAEALADGHHLHRLWDDALTNLREDTGCRVLDLPTLGCRDAATLGGLDPGGLRVYGIDPGARLPLPSTWARYWSTVTVSRQKRMQAERRALERDHGAINFEVIDGGAAMASAVGEFWALREAAWQQRGRYEQLATHVKGVPLRSFLRELAAGICARDGLVAVGRLTVGDSLAAAALLLHARRRVWYAMCAFAPPLARYGPGRLLLAESVRASIERQLDAVELGRGVEPYKFALGAGRYELPNVTLPL